MFARKLKEKALKLEETLLHEIDAMKEAICDPNCPAGIKEKLMSRLKKIAMETEKCCEKNGIQDKENGSC